MIKAEQPREKIYSAREDKVIREFIKKVLSAFNAQKPFPPLIETADRRLEWQFYINRFFFIERGKEKNPADAPDYIALMQRQKDADIELWRAESRAGATRWNFQTRSVSALGQPLAGSVERSDEAAIKMMIAYLFENDYIVADVEDDEDEDEIGEGEENMPLIG